MNSRRPIHEIRFGFVKAAIWENQGKDNTWYNVTFQRNYKDGKDWKFADNFNRDDLLVLAKAADQAHTWICDQRATNNDRQRDQRQ